jgi:hypothetical protein
MTRRARILAAIIVALSLPAAAFAHSGPPYPAVSSQVVGRYTVQVWTDPDTTDDQTAQGKFWVMLDAPKDVSLVDGRTHVDVTIAPTDRPGAPESLRADLQRKDPVTFYVVLPMHHEGPFAVHVAIDGPSGRGQLDCEVQATYDLRPARMLLLLYVMPFLLVALLWAKLLIARRRAARAPASAS